MAATLSRTRAVMDLAGTINIRSEGAATFVSQAADTGKVTRSIMLDIQDWLDLGSPEQITVDIVPGDTLNPA